MGHALPDPKSHCPRRSGRNAPTPAAETVSGTVRFELEGSGFYGVAMDLPANDSGPGLLVLDGAAGSVTEATDADVGPILTPSTLDPLGGPPASTDAEGGPPPQPEGQTYKRMVVNSPAGKTTQIMTRKGDTWVVAGKMVIMEGPPPPQSGFAKLYGMLQGAARAYFTHSPGQDVKVKTKYTTIGVRGTVFSVDTYACANGASVDRVEVTEGAVEVTNEASGEVTLVNAGEALRSCESCASVDLQCAAPAAAPPESSSPTGPGGQDADVVDATTDGDAPFDPKDSGVPFDPKDSGGGAVDAGINEGGAEAGADAG